MGTEICLQAYDEELLLPGHVKLNNPLMGTEIVTRLT